MNFIKSAFADKAVVDERTPLLTFRVLGEEYGLFAPRVVPWNQLLLVQLLGATAQVAFAIAIYHLIVRRNRGTCFAHALGWGVIIPLSAWATFAFLDYAEVHNRYVALAAAGLPTCVFFRCVEAMHGCAPDCVEDSLLNYATYYSSLSPLVWDKKTRTVKRPQPSQVLRLALEVASYFVAASALVSVALATAFEPFGATGIDPAGLDLSPAMFSGTNLANAYFRTWVTYCTYKLGFEAAGLGEQAKGLATRRCFDAPLTKSRTPTEFWTRRWNVMVHSLLKTGAFAPARKFFSRRWSVFLTFVVSGLYHDCAWRVMFHDVPSKGCAEPDRTPRPDACYDPRFGRVTAFFAVVGLFMILERPVSALPAVRWLSARLPTFVVAQLLVLIHLPFAHW